MSNICNLLIAFSILWLHHDHVTLYYDYQELSVVDPFLVLSGRETAVDGLLLNRGNHKSLMTFFLKCNSNE